MVSRYEVIWDTGPSFYLFWIYILNSIWSHPSWETFSVFIMHVSKWHKQYLGFYLAVTVDTSGMQCEQYSQNMKSSLGQFTR